MRGMQSLLTVVRGFYNMKKVCQFKALCFLTSSLSILSGGAFAQIEETTSEQTASGDTIIVTATKRASTLQDVPFSINAQTADDIRRTGASTIEDVARNVAGLTIQNLGPGQSQVAIRGVSSGQIVRDQPGVKEQVGVYLDESVISLSLFTPDLDLFDFNRVETLRGPQGTLFGGFDGTEDPRELIDTELDDYTLFNLFAGLDFDRTNILLYINNIFDENAQYSFDRERGGRARLGIHVGQPRTIGMTVRQSF